MKITDVKATPVAIPLKPSKAELPMHKGPETVNSIIVRIYTDEGYVGIGETPAGFGIEAAVSLINAAKPLLIGENANNVNVLMKRIYIHFNLTQMHIASASWAFAGIETALWDIFAQSSNLPLYQVWGGTFRDDAELIGIVERRGFDEMEKDARELASLGYNMLYTRTDTEPELDVEAVAAMRRGAPNLKVKICVDGNQSWSTGVAINTINRMEQYGLGWVEQPVIMHNFDALQDVKTGINVPILGHQSNRTMYDVLNVFKNDCVDFIKLDGRFDAGYAGVRTSAGIAEAGGVQCVYDGSYQLGISLAMALHVIAATPNFTMPNHMPGCDRLTDDIIVGGPLKKDNGPLIPIPQAPGIGVKLDEDKLLRYSENYIKVVTEQGSVPLRGKTYDYAAFMRPFFKDYND